jgi:hypothetical protein
VETAVPPIVAEKDASGGRWRLNEGNPGVANKWRIILHLHRITQKLVQFPGSAAAPMGSGSSTSSAPIPGRQQL